MIANGDHIYWDMTTAMARTEPAYVRDQLWPKFGGAFDLSLPMDTITVSVFMWRPPQPVDEIDTMKPALVYDVRRRMS